MNRTERLTAIVMLLQNEQLTSKELAQRFEVSKRTILRDVQALSEMGVPIVAEWGPGGGYSLLPEYSLSPLQLTFREALLLLSGRSHRVFTSITLVAPGGREKSKVVDTKVRFKRLSRADIDAYLLSDEWRGKAGGYAIQGKAAAFVRFLSGSYSCVVGLPVHETLQMLQSAGYPVYAHWTPET